jgi:transcriptional regulator with XRE-family HTH domain
MRMVGAPLVNPSEIPTFGDYLTAIMDDRAWSAERLSAVLGVDRSLVYRWRRDDRAPKLDTPYLDQIAALLELTPEEHETLERARIRTLREYGTRRHTARRSTSEASPRLTWLPRGDGAVRGRQQSFEAELELLGGVPTAPADGEHEIILVSILETVARTSQERRSQDQWQQALRTLMARGWTLTVLWRLVPDPARTGQIVTRLLDLAGNPRFQPRHFLRHGYLRPPYNGLIVPGYAGYVELCADNPAAPDAALFYRDAGMLAALYGHFRQLKSLTRPLLECLHQDDMSIGGAESARWDGLPGGRCLVTRELSFFSEPRSWSRLDSTWARRQSCSPDELAHRIEMRRRRHARLDEHVAVAERKEICAMRTASAHLREDSTRSSYAGQVERRQMVAARVEHLRHVIHLLKSREQYQLALASDDEAATLRLDAQPPWMVMGSNQAILTTSSAGASGHRQWMDAVVKEPAVATALHRRFLEMWRKIAPERRDKALVIGLLENLVSEYASP